MRIAEGTQLRRNSQPSLTQVGIRFLNRWIVGGVVLRRHTTYQYITLPKVEAQWKDSQQ